MSIALKLRRLPHGRDMPLPAYATPGAAGLDLSAAVEAGTPLVIAPGDRALVPTGFTIALPAGHEAQVRPAQGLALRHGVTVLNAPGTIDSDYRGEVMVLLINFGTDPFAIARGDRIAQVVVTPVTHAEAVEDELDATLRGADGFGSTGIGYPAARGASA